MTLKMQLGIIFSCVLLAVTTACSAGSSGDTANKEKSKTKDGKAVVTLSLKMPDPFYEAAEKKFEAKYPDIDLQFQYFKQPGQEWAGFSDLENYIKTTNTAMLSGKGADIIETSSLPEGKYINKKLLVDMSEWLDQDKTINKDDLQMNILDASKIDGGLYTMPSAFSLSAFIGDGEVLENTSVKVNDKNWSWVQFADITKQLMSEEEEKGKDHRYALTNNPPELILQEMVMDSYNEFVDPINQKANFESPLFENMLLHIKQMYDDNVLSSTPVENENPLFNSARMFSPADFIDGPYLLFSNPNLLQRPHGEGQSGEARIVTSSKLAIHANSSVKEEAWKFVAFLLSEEAQSLAEREGFSLLKALNEKKFDNIQAQIKSGTFKLANEEQAKVPDEDFEQFRVTINSANRYANVDAKVVSIIYDEAIAFLAVKSLLRMWLN